MTRKLEQTVWPSQSQLELLKIVIKGSPDSKLLEHQSEIRKLIESEDNKQILPSLYWSKKHLTSSILEEYSQSLKLHYMSTWASNKLLLDSIIEVSELLRRANISFWLLKGFSCWHLYYRDQGARPMNDVDLLVEKCCLKKAVQVLEQNGWRLLIHYNLDTELESGHAVTLINKHKVHIDLHFHIFHTIRNERTEDKIKANSQKIRLQNKEIYCLSDTDNFVNIMTHGMRWCNPPAIRWIIDCCLIVNEGRIDYNLLLERSRALKISYLTLNCSKFLKETFNADIPAWFIAELDARQICERELTVYRLNQVGHLSDSLTKLLHNYRKIKLEKSLYGKDYGICQHIMIPVIGIRGIKLIWLLPILILKKLCTSLKGSLSK